VCTKCFGLSGATIPIYQNLGEVTSYIILREALQQHLSAKHLLVSTAAIDLTLNKQQRRMFIKTDDNEVLLNVDPKITKLRFSTPLININDGRKIYKTFTMIVGDEGRYYFF